MSFSHSVGRLSLMLLLGAVGCAETHRLDLQIDRPSGVDGPLVVQVASVPGGRCEGAPPMDWSSAGSVSVGEGAQAIWVRAWDEACENCSLGCSMADIAQGASPSVSLMPVDCAGFPCRMLPEGGVDAGDASMPIEEDAGDGGSDAGDSGEPVPDGCAGRRVLAAGLDHVCVAPGDQTVRCWGEGGESQLGSGLTFESPVCELGLGHDHSCALLEDGTVWCWGDNRYSRLGDGGSSGERLEPAMVQGSDGRPLMGMQQLSVGSSHSCALDGDGNVLCWGRNTARQLGGACAMGGDCDESRAVQALVSEATLIASGYGASCSLSEAFGVGPQVHCWGHNDRDRLRVGTAGNVAPTRTTVRDGAADVRDLCLGGYMRSVEPHHSNFACAAFDDGVHCWGLNYLGELGGAPTEARDGTARDHRWAGAAPSAVTCGAIHGCALVDGDVRCWGNNRDSAVGESLVDGESHITLEQAVVDVVAGGRFTCALDAAGEVFCWGTSTNVFGPSGGSLAPRRMEIPAAH